jgi:hypothetical protein
LIHDTGLHPRDAQAAGAATGDEVGPGIVGPLELGIEVEEQLVPLDRAAEREARLNEVQVRPGDEPARR